MTPLPTVKFQSGQEVSLAAFLLKLTSLDGGQARKPAIDRERAGVRDADQLVRGAR
ncbi:MAG TPA: hypothetical protein VES92_09975 [Nitrospiraceae bacterium]|nr:hypothetical protein [Nitrospiraceae bacterium]